MQLEEVLLMATSRLLCDFSDLLFERFIYECSSTIGIVGAQSLGVAPEFPLAFLHISCVFIHICIFLYILKTLYSVQVWFRAGAIHINVHTNI